MNMFNFIPRLVIVLLFSFLLFCENKIPGKKIIKQETFIQLYCDIVSKYDMIEPSRRKAFQDSIFAYYAVSEKIFQNTIAAYNENPSEWKEVFEKITAELEKRAKQTEISDNKKNIKS